MRAWVPVTLALPPEGKIVQTKQQAIGGAVYRHDTTMRRNDMWVERRTVPAQDGPGTITVYLMLSWSPTHWRLRDN